MINKKRKKFGRVGSMALFLLLTACSSNDDSHLKQEMVTAQLQEVIDEKVGNDADKLVGVSVSIRVGTEERWKLVGGISKLGLPISSDMKFGIGSITKTVVAATIMKLVDEEILTLEDTIGDWLKLDLPNVNNNITIFQLLTHTSYLQGYMYSDLWDKAEADLNTPIDPIDLTNFIGTPKVEPNRYSNSNYLLLGLIIEAATNKTVGEVMRENFWTPLDLTTMYFGANESIPEPICTPWRDSDGDGTLEDIKADYGAAFHSIFYCAADVFSTASDLSMWAQHLYNGNAISESSRTKMMTSYYDIPDPTFTGYGLGVRKNNYAGQIMWGHTGGMRGYGSHMFYDPESKVSIAILNNQSRSVDGPALRHELIEELLQIVQENIF